MHDWSDPAFLTTAVQWIEEHVRVAGEPEQVHLQPWSTVLRVPSAEGTVWFKAARDGVEIAVTELLHRAVPDRAPELLASDADRGWMLLADAGVRLRELIETPEDLWRWEQFLPEYGQLQLTMSSLAQELLDAGVPDVSLSGLAQRSRSCWRSPSSCGGARGGSDPGHAGPAVRWRGYLAAAPADSRR